MTTVNW